MSSQHRDPSMNVRVPAELKAATQQALGGRELRGFVLACCTALVADPPAFLAGLEDHWPPPNPVGRPSKASPPADGRREAR
ncbi:hypothetical protein ACEZCY_36080 [Streptacidiphilus sp. N1-12]|uniref:DUF1778 domain-containing protein n=1 Tax=Streptacidiphilus alkalitolerans TaxID=3342712 RepID=A0ABV6WRG2_9ACTN